MASDIPQIWQNRGGKFFKTTFLLLVWFVRLSQIDFTYSRKLVRDGVNVLIVQDPHMVCALAFPLMEIV